MWEFNRPLKSSPVRKERMLLRETKAKNENALMTLAMRPVREGEKAIGEMNAVVVVAVREEDKISLYSPE